jgi:DNA-binding transcriptional regulator YiaG
VWGVRRRFDGNTARISSLKFDPNLEGIMTNIEFKAEQANLGLTNEKLAFAFRVSIRTVEKWRQGSRKIPGPVCALFALCGEYSRATSVLLDREI